MYLLGIVIINIFYSTAMTKKEKEENSKFEAIVDEDKLYSKINIEIDIEFK